MSGDIGKLSASGASADVLEALKNLIASAANDAALLLSQGIIPKLVDLINGHTDQKVKILSNSLLSLLVATSESASDVLFDDTLLVLINLTNSDNEALANQAADGVASIVKENPSFQVLQISPYILAQIAEVLESDTTPLSTKQKVIAIVPLLIANVDATPDEEDTVASAPAAASADGGHPPFPGPSPTRLFAQSLGLLVPTLHKLSQNSAAANIKADVDGLIKQIGDRFHKAHSKWFKGGPGAGGPPGGWPGGSPGGGPGFGGPWGPGFGGPGGFRHGFFGRGGFGRHHHGFGHEWKRGGRGKGWGPGGFGGFGGKGPGGPGGPPASGKK